MGFAVRFRTIFTPMNFPSQGHRRSNLHWTSSRGPGSVSCTTRGAAPFSSNFQISQCTGTEMTRTVTGEAMGGVYPGQKTKSVHVRNHIRSRPNLFRCTLSKIFTPMNFPSQGRRRSNLHVYVCMLVSGTPTQHATHHTPHTPAPAFAL